MNKKILPVLMLLLSLAKFCQAQNSGKIVYDFKFPSLTRGSITVKALLEFRDSTSLFTYYKIALEDSIPNLAKVTFDSARGAVIMSSPYDEKGSQIFRDFRNRQIIFRQSRAKPMDPFVVQDNWVDIDWKILNDRKNILGYTCQKATGNFRGRSYEIWFTQAIPGPYGPWKLFGLPGVILEASDKKNMVHFIARKISVPDSSVNAIPIPQEDKRKTIKEFVHDDDYYLEQVETAFKQKLPPGLTIKLSEKDRTTPDKIKVQRKFSMEKEYEWEKDIDKKKESKLNIKSE